MIVEAMEWLIDGGLVHRARVAKGRKMSERVTNWTGGYLEGLVEALVMWLEGCVHERMNYGKQASE